MRRMDKENQIKMVNKTMQETLPGGGFHGGEQQETLPGGASLEIMSDNKKKHETPLDGSIDTCPSRMIVQTLPFGAEISADGKLMLSFPPQCSRL